MSTFKEFATGDSYKTVSADAILIHCLNCDFWDYYPPKDCGGCSSVKIKCTTGILRTDPWLMAKCPEGFWKRVDFITKERACPH